MTDQTPHPSDRVLEKTIEGLTNLTNERFKNTENTLGRLEKKIDDISNAGYITKSEYNERHAQLESRVNNLELENNKRYEELKTAKDIADGRLQSVQWVWGVIIVVIGIGEFVISRLF